MKRLAHSIRSPTGHFWRPISASGMGGRCRFVTSVTRALTLASYCLPSTKSSGHIAVEEPSCGSAVGGLMSRARSSFVLLFLCLFAGCATYTAQTVAETPHVAYLDPAIQGTSGAVNVIVTGRDSRAAALVVESAGGEVTSDLWIINAVAATIPSDSIQRIASDPAILSIISNKKVRASDWNGWMSELRVARGTYSFSTSVVAPTAFLPDGGFVAVSVGGELLIANEDGSERKRVSLPAGTYSSSPVVRPDSSFYVLGTSSTGTLSHFSATGALLWRANVPVASNLTAQLALGEDRVYCLDGKGTLFSIDAEDGWIRWQLSLPTRSTNPLSPVIGSNRIYVAMGSGE